MVEYRTSLPFRTPLPLRSLRTAADLLLIAADHATDPVVYRVSAPDGNTKPTVVFEHSKLAAAMPSEQVNMARVVDQALQIASSFGVDDEELICLGELQDQEEMIISMRKFFGAAPGELVAPYDRAVDAGSLFGVVGDMVLHLERITLVATFGVYGRVSTVEHHPELERYKITVPDAVPMIDKTIVPASELGSFDVRAAHEKMAARLRQMGCENLTYFTVAQPSSDDTER